MNDLLLAELALALRTGRLWSIVLRNAIPVAGVYLLGWPATLALLFYLLEIWLYLSLRSSMALGLDDAGEAPAANSQRCGSSPRQPSATMRTANHATSATTPPSSGATSWRRWA